MAYGKILVDQVKNSDGKSLNVGPSARVFDTVTDLQASNTLSDGDIVIVKERANAEYKIQPSTYTALDGDLTLTSGQVAELQLKPVNDVRWWGAVNDYDESDMSGTDNESAINSALLRANGYDMMILSGGGGAYRIGSPLVFKNRRCYLRDIVLAASPDWDAGTVDATDLGSAISGRSAAQLSNRGKPMVVVDDSDVDWPAYQFRQVGMTDFLLLCNNVAPGLYVHETRFGLFSNFEIFEAYGYGLAMIEKNTETKVSHGKINESDYYGAGHADPSLYTSYGYVQTCADVVVEGLVANYCKCPIWADGFANTQWSNIHVYNGNDLGEFLIGVYVGPNCDGIMCSNLYLDGVYVELHSFNHLFNGGKVATMNTSDTAKRFAFKAVADSADTNMYGLIIDGFVSRGGYEDVMITDETSGNFGGLSNTTVNKFAAKGEDRSQISSYLNNKRLYFYLDAADWVAEGSVWIYEIDLNSYLCFPDLATRLVFDYADRGTASGRSPLEMSYDFDEAAGSGKIVTLRSSEARKCRVTLVLDEGLY